MKTRLLWTFHTVINALPAGILAHTTLWRRPEDTAAMIAVTLLFIAVVPLTPWWALMGGHSSWSRAVRSALWIRTVWSLILLVLLAIKSGRAVAFFEVWIGTCWALLFERGARTVGMSHLSSGWGMTALMTLVVGLTLLGLVGVLACLVHLLMRSRERRWKRQ